MVIISLTGGLGNQLFQYAFGRKLAIASGQRLFLSAETFLTDYLQRSFALSPFPVKAKLLSHRQYQYFLQPGGRGYGWLKRLRLLNIVEDDNLIRHDIAPAFGVNHYRGYWQTARYFEDIRPALLEELTISNDAIARFRHKIQHSGTPVCVHVRRKDYLNDERFGFLGLDYYLEAISYFSEHFKDVCFFVFSDDIEWCKLQFGETERFVFIDPSFGFRDYEELQLMTACKHHIIANSSFSWWGAWLCPNVSQIVIRPEQPFRDASLQYEAYYPDNWKIIRRTTLY